MTSPSPMTSPRAGNPRALSLLYLAIFATLPGLAMTLSGFHPASAPMLGLMVYGAAMEVAQSFTAHRVGDPWDWLADAVGLLALLPFVLRRRRLG